MCAPQAHNAPHVRFVTIEVSAQVSGSGPRHHTCLLRVLQGMIEHLQDLDEILGVL